MRWPSFGDRCSDARAQVHASFPVHAVFVAGPFPGCLRKIYANNIQLGYAR